MIDHKTISYSGEKLKTIPFYLSPMKLNIENTYRTVTESNEKECRYLLIGHINNKKRANKRLN